MSIDEIEVPARRVSPAHRPPGRHPSGGQCRHAEGRTLAGEDGLHRRLQGPCHWPSPRAQAQRRRRRARRSCRAWSRAARRVRLSDRLLPLLGAGARTRRLVYGQFGENFTVEGLSNDEVCIGDRYRIGTAVCEVTQPRVTCYRVGIRMNEPRIEPAVAWLATGALLGAVLPLLGVPVIAA